MCGQLQANYACKDERKTDQPCSARRFIKQDNAQYCCTNGTDTHPDSIGRTDGEGFHCNAEQAKAD